jgi:phage terminase small subunit
LADAIKSAYSQGHDLLKKPKIQAESNAIFKSIDLSAQRIAAKIEL